jgi:glycosidase
MKIFFQSVLFLLILSQSARGQLIVSDPAFPQDNQSVVITFNASLGNAGLAGYTGDVYAHTGVITNLSTGPSDWKYVKTNWGQNTAATKLTKIGTDLYTLAISPNIRSYYNVPASETILKMAFVFRSATAVNGTSYLEGKTSAGGDIFVDVYEEGLNVSFVNPENYGTLLQLNDQLQINVAGTLCNSISLYVNGVLQSTQNGTTLTTTLTASAYGKYRVKAVATGTSGTVEDSIYYFVRPPVQVQAMPLNTQYGINYVNDSTVVLALHAPYKSYVFVPGSYSNWELDDQVYMKQAPTGGIWWIELTGLDADMEYSYQYWVNGTLKIADPYAEKVLDPWNDSYISSSVYPNPLAYPVGKTEGIVSAFKINQEDYTWQTTQFTPPEKEKMVIYELLIRDFTSERSLDALIDTLGYLEYLGVNVIELMPVNEFEGNLSWGYNPSFYFAVDKFYGTSNKLKEFIDICHQKGIAVVLDVVFNHSFGQSPMVQLYWDGNNNQPASNNLWFNTQPKHDYNVGYDFNHESTHTRQYVKRVLKFWLEEYRVDGFRYDLSKGFTQTNTLGNVSLWGQHDPSRVTILKDYGDYVWSINSDAMNILEHFADNTEEKILANYGFMLWGNMNYNYNEATMGYTTNDLSWGVYTSRGWNDPNLVTYMESHDEERLMYKNLEYGNVNGTYSVKDLSTALKRVELASNFFIPLAGPKMIWQFGEFGYDINIDYNGRTGVKPLKWNYYSEPDRNRLFHVFKALINLKKTEPAFSEGTFSNTLSSYLKEIYISHSTMNVAILGNFNVTAADISPNFQESGLWYEYFTGDSVEIQNTTAPINLQPGEYRLYTTKKFDKPVLENIPIGINDPNLSRGAVQVYPNPSTEEVYLVVQTTQSNPIRLEIYDQSGRIVYSHAETLPSAGLFQFVWNGRDLGSNLVSQGVYFCRIISGEYVYTSRIIRY